MPIHQLIQHQSKPLTAWVVGLFVLLSSVLLHAAEQPSILVIGDSLSAAYGIEEQQGWVALLQDRLKAQNSPYKVVNASISGDTTEGGLSRLPQALNRFRPQVLIIALGANDGLRGTSLKRMRQNLTKMIQQAKLLHITTLLIGMELPPNYGPTYRQQFAQSFIDVAQQQHVALVPFLLVKIALQKSLFQDDGLHPIAEAHPQLLDTVWPELEKLIHTGSE